MVAEDYAALAASNPIKAGAGMSDSRCPYCASSVPNGVSVCWSCGRDILWINGSHWRAEDEEYARNIEDRETGIFPIKSFLGLTVWFFVGLCISQRKLPGLLESIVGLVVSAIFVGLLVVPYTWLGARFPILEKPLKIVYFSLVGLISIGVLIAAIQGA
jgi:hypothetical protein